MAELITLLEDVLVGEAQAAFAAAWPGLKLDVYNPSDEFYKEGLPDRRLPAEPLRARGAQSPGSAEIDGTMTGHQVRNVVYAAFGVETQIAPRTDFGETLDAAVARLDGANRGLG